MIQYQEIFKSWYIPLKKFIEDNFYIDRLFKFLDSEYSNKVIYPNKKNVFKALQLTDYKELKVVILGQDPYFNGAATGIAFANNDDIRESVFSPSLIKIKECIERTNKDDLYLNFDPTLENWSRQGVLLLNTSLTVVKNSPNSHRKYWNKFTKELIKTINSNKTGIIFLLWGGEAREYKQYINEKIHYVLEDVHPAYAARQKTEWNCNHFNKVNEIIKGQNGKDYTIRW